MRHGLRQADHVEDEVELCAGPTMGRAETFRRSELPLIEIERVDLRRACEPRALDDGETDGAAADDGDARSLPDPGGVQHRADAGGDATADQARLFRRQPLRAGNRRSRMDDGPRRERSHLQRLRKCTPVGDVEAISHSRRGAAAADVAALAPAAGTAG